MNPDDQKRRAEELLALHHRKSVLVLPNAWDVISAKIYEAEGFPAVATTSAGIAATLGYPDGERIGRDEMLETVGRIAGRLSVPLSADLETGYSEEPEGVAECCVLAARAGVAGVNLEDSTGDRSAPLYKPSAMYDRIRAVREAVAAERRRLVVNARIDVYLVTREPAEELLEHTIARGKAYVEAGADSIFVPTMEPSLDESTISRLADEIGAPLNLLASNKGPSIADLARLGVSRVTFGPRAMRTALALVREMAREWRDDRTSSLMTEGLSYRAVNRLLKE